MHALIMAIIVAVLSFRYFTRNEWAPQLLNYVPELLSLLAAVLVVAVGVQSRFRYVHPAYWFLFGGLGIVAVCGAIANSLEPGTAFAAVRTYMRALPLFFLPAVIALEDRRLRVQLYVLLAACFVQLPLAWQQRMSTLASGGTTGDYTVGTFGTSHTLTLFMAAAASVLAGFYVKKRLSGKFFFPLLAVVLAPTMLNETKGALIVAPLALLIVFVAGSRPGARIKNALLATGLVACFGAAFVPVYDHFMEPRWGYGLVEFVTRDGRLEQYLDRGTEVGEYDRSAGKVGGPIAALQIIGRDPVQLVFGLGIGSVSDSALGEQFGGRYVDVYAPLIENAAGYIIFEFGLAGLVLLMLLYWRIFRDCLHVARMDPGIKGALAVGWAGVVLVMLLGLMYSPIMDSMALSALFWYFSGLVAAYRMRMTIDAAPALSEAQAAYKQSDSPPSPAAAI